MRKIWCSTKDIDLGVFRMVKFYLTVNGKLSELSNKWIEIHIPFLPVVVISSCGITWL